MLADACIHEIIVCVHLCDDVNLRQPRSKVVWHCQGISCPVAPKHRLVLPAGLDAGMAHKQSAGQPGAAANSRRLRLIAAILVTAISTTCLLIREGERAPLWLKRRLDGADEGSSSPGLGSWDLSNPAAAVAGNASGGAAGGVPAAAAAVNPALGGGTALRVHLAPGVQHIEQPAVSMWQAGTPFTAPHSRCTVLPDGGSWGGVGWWLASCHRA